MNKLKKSVLLLNSSYEPLSLISVERAIRLKLKDEVNFEEVLDNVYISSPTEKWNLPSVVRLKNYINVIERRRASASKRERIYIRDRYKCSYCGVKCNRENITLDHIIPKSQGGLNSPENLVTACFSCNQKKGNRGLKESGMILKHTPTKLKVGLDKHVLNHYAEMNPLWKRYLFLEDSGFTYN